MLTIAPPRTALTVDPGSATAAVMGTRTSGFYRHDLDGLRGVAILLVAMFHIWFGRVSGGVDVFLALSGFFFGGRLLRAALNPSA
jgi:peptidoglycan/LPS O-acetylase OafA/YrhL